MRIAVLLLAFSATAAETDPARMCASCHPAQARSHAGTGMARALETAAKEPILRNHARLEYRQGPYHYVIERQGDRSVYIVEDGQQEVRIPIEWAFGLGAAGQTYGLRRGQVWYESRVSYYKEIDGLDLTTGARPDVPRNLEEAIGREMTDRGIGECFNCHATGAIVDGKLRTDTLVAGIQCARCHTRTAEHAASMLQRGSARIVPPRLGQMPAEETSNFCGQCHRTWAQIAASGPHNIANIRFQPYRLANSKCFDVSDSRIRCTACHNPHADAVRNTASYDSRCAACHNEKPCKAGKTSNCASCHMPKTDLPGAHFLFTDHWIRVVRPGDRYPN